MNVIVAESSGFCFGVKRAMDMALEAGAKASAKHPVYSDGPLIHNPQALDQLRNRNVEPLEDLCVPPDSTVIIRSHGITPQRRSSLEATGATIIDATCPRVKKVQSIIKEHADKGCFVIIVGEADHAEVKGLLGYAGENGIALLTLDELAALPEGRNLCVVAQTTQNREKFLRLAEKIKGRFPDAEIFDTICNANRRRQEELLELCRRVDAVVVAGGKESGNTRRLVEIARAALAPAFFAETADDLDPEDFKGVQTVGVIGGASTPGWVLEEVVERLKSF